MIVIVDYGFGNKINLSSALDKIKVDHLISSKKKDIENCSHLILPGVGAFKTTINHLKKKKLLNTIKDIAKKKPVLGICLGMQLLFDYSTENGKTKGLGLLKGSVKKFDFKNKNIKIPNIGWNKVMDIKKNKIFLNINKMDEFYFVHSYYIKTKEKKVIMSNSKYNNFSFASVINKKNIYGCQFHPERSRNQGLIFLKNFCNI
tara:strand:+ start:532 stop:1140 length:609 start_codon:yes stop_codon:yes gene_type:complete